MKVIGHEVYPVDIISHSLKIKMLQIPVGSRGRKCEYIVTQNCGPKLLEKSRVVNPVAICASAVRCTWVLPVKVNSVKTVLSLFIVSSLPKNGDVGGKTAYKKADKVGNELGTVAFVGNNGREYILPFSGISEAPSS